LRGIGDPLPDTVFFAQILSPIRFFYHGVSSNSRHFRFQAENLLDAWPSFRTAWICSRPQSAEMA